MKKLLRFIKDEEGVTSIEYGLIAALIAIVIVVAVTLVGKHQNFYKLLNCYIIQT